VTSIASAVGIARLLGADSAIVGGFRRQVRDRADRDGHRERIGVSPTLTAVFAVSTGILGAVLARFVLDAVRSREWWQRGFAIASPLTVWHLEGVQRQCGSRAYSSLAMGLHGVLGAVLIPLAGLGLGF